jgi:hypothetical protein
MSESRLELKDEVDLNERSDFALVGSGDFDFGCGCGGDSEAGAGFAFFVFITGLEIVLGFVVVITLAAVGLLISLKNIKI